MRFGLERDRRAARSARGLGSTYIDPLTETRIRGNPELVTSPIENFDLRAEWFFENGDNFTVSLFYKDIESPIETVQGAGTDDNISLTFINAESADLRVSRSSGSRTCPRSGRDSSSRSSSPGNVTLSDSELTRRRRRLQRDERRAADVAALRLCRRICSSGSTPTTARIRSRWPTTRSASGCSSPAATARPTPTSSRSTRWTSSTRSIPTDRLSMKFRIQNLLDEELEIDAGRTSPCSTERRHDGEDRRQVGPR